MLDRVRLEASAKLNRQRKVELGQFLTPSSVAKYMASLLNSTAFDEYFRRFAAIPRLTRPAAYEISKPEYALSLGRWASRQGELTQEEIDSRCPKIIIQNEEHEFGRTSANTEFAAAAH